MGERGVKIFGGWSVKKFFFKILKEHKSRYGGVVEFFSGSQNEQNSRYEPKLSCFFKDFFWCFLADLRGSVKVAMSQNSQIPTTG